MTGGAAFAGANKQQITFGAGGTGTQTSGAGVIAPSYPASITGGMLLLLLVKVKDAGVAAITTPSGWTLITSSSVASTNLFKAFYKVADGTESGTLSVTVTDSAYAVARIYRFSNGTGVEAANSNNSAGSSTTCSNVNVTTTLTLEMACQCYSWEGTATTIGNSSGESGADYTEAVAVYASATAGLDLQTATCAAASTITGGSATLGAAKTNHENIGFAFLP